MLHRLSISLLTWCFAVGLWGQTDPVSDALRHYQAGDLAKARATIDHAMNDPASRVDPEALLLRGFIYKDLYKDPPAGEEADALRSTALESLRACADNDAEGKYRDNLRQAYEFMVRSYFNDAAKALGERSGDHAERFFDEFRKGMRYLDPKVDITTREVEFLNALGTMYTKQFNEDRRDTAKYGKAAKAFLRVLELEPGNYGANYNLATLHYNRGVYNIRNINADADIPTIQQIQEVSREFFQLALPYMLKAHEMNPRRRETLLGLEGIYYSLQDMDNSERYRELFEELPPE